MHLVPQAPLGCFDSLGDDPFHIREQMVQLDVETLKAAYDGAEVPATRE